MSTSKDFTAGQILTASQLDDFPQGILKFSQTTSNSSTTSGTTETDIFTSSSFTIAQTGRRIKVSYQTRGYECTQTNDAFIIRIKEGSTIFAEAVHQVGVTSSAEASGAACFFAIIDNPSAASHTYKVTAQRTIGTGTLTASGTSNGPATMIVEDIGTN